MFLPLFTIRCWLIRPLIGHPTLAGIEANPEHFTGVSSNLSCIDCDMEAELVAEVKATIPLTCNP